MKRAFIVTCLATLCLAEGAMARQVRRPTGRISVEREISALEARRFKAMTEGDLAALGSILGDDLTYTHSSGLTQSKSEFIEMLRSGKLRYLSIELANETVRGYGATAVGAGRGAFKVNSNGKEETLQLRFTDVYVRRGGQWRLVAWQSTRLPQ